MIPGLSTLLWVLDVKFYPQVSFPVPIVRVRHPFSVDHFNVFWPADKNLVMPPYTTFILFLKWEPFVFSLHTSPLQLWRHGSSDRPKCWWSIRPRRATVRRICWSSLSNRRPLSWKPGEACPQRRIWCHLKWWVFHIDRSLMKNENFWDCIMKIWGYYTVKLWKISSLWCLLTIWNCYP